MAHEVTLIPGDGTGPELIEATRRVLEATGVEFEWDEHPAGEDVYNDEGSPFPDRTLDSVKRTGVGIKGPTTTPVGSGFRSVNVLLRKELDLYAGIEFERGTEDNEKLTRFLADELDSPVGEGSGISIKPISEFGSDRIVESAFLYAEANGRKKVTAAHKANIMKHTDGLFLDVARKVAERHPDIEFEDRIIDNLCNQLVSRQAGDKLEAAIAAVIKQGDKVTYDLKPSREDPSAVGTSEFADAVIEEMN